jgi:hypothetical protein
MTGFGSGASTLAMAAIGMSLLVMPPASHAQERIAALAQERVEDAARMAALPPAHCVPPPPDMDAWYPLDGSGIDLILGKNANAFGSANYLAPAVVQKGGLLPIPNSYFSIAPGPVLNQGLGDFSIDMWLFVPSHWLSGPGSVRTLIDKRTNAGGVRGYSLFVYNSRLGVQLADGSYTNYGQSGSSPALTPGWNHIAVTIDRDNPQGVVFYRNGAIASTANPTGRQGNLDNKAPTLIGRNAFGDGGTSEKAIFDEIEFFDRVLQPAEVKMIYAAGPAGKCK